MKQNKHFLAFLCGLLSLALLLTATGSGAPVRARAATSGQIKEEINDLRDERSEIQKEMQALSQTLDANMEQIEQMVAEKNVIDQEIGLLTREIQLINEEVKAYGLLIADKQEELEQAQKDLEAVTQQNKDRIRAMEEDGDLSYWSVLFRANDFSDLLDRLNIVQEIAAADRRRLDDMRQAREAVEQAHEALTAEKAAMEETRLQLEQSQTKLAQKRVEADKKLAELNDRKEEFLEKLAEAEEADNALMMEIAQKEKEYNAQKAAEDAANRPQVGQGQMPPSNITNGLSWTVPCNYIRLSSPYGYRVHPVYGSYSFHDGVDLAGPSGTPIVATRGGTVTIAQFSSTAGYYVSINHGDGFSSVYMHMTHFIVSYGQQVQQGQVIGYMGSTGLSTGPHLHFGLSYNGSSQNPAAYINFY